MKIYKTQLNTNEFTLFTILTANRVFLFSSHNLRVYTTHSQ